MTMTHPTAVFQTDLPLPGRRQGKVRDIYEVGDALLLVSKVEALIALQLG